MIHYGKVKRHVGRVTRAVMRDNVVCIGRIDRNADVDSPRCFIVMVNGIIGYAWRLSDAKRFAGKVAA